MRIRLLGALSINGATAPELSTTRREGRILAALLLSAERPVSTDALIEMLWSDRPPATARQQLQNCAAALGRSLRSRLDGTSVERRASAYLIHARPDDLDASVFERHVRAGRRLAAEGGAREAVQEFRAGLDLWRGDVLDGADLGPFQPMSVRLSELRLAAVEECLALELRLGRSRYAVPELTLLVQAHPYREELVGLLMKALVGSGRVTEALEAYRRARRRLVGEYGVEPGPGLRSLHERILRGGDAAESSGDGLPGDPATVLTAALSQLDQLRSQLDVALRHIHRTAPAVSDRHA